MADEKFPGPKTRAALERGIPLFKNGLRFGAEMERAGKRGFRPVRQIVIDKADGDFVWDLDGKRYIDFQNGWATNPLGNCNPEILEVVEAANRRFGFHYDHPLRYDLAENARPTLCLARCCHERTTRYRGRRPPKPRFTWR